MKLIIQTLLLLFLFFSSLTAQESLDPVNMNFSFYDVTNGKALIPNRIFLESLEPDARSTFLTISPESHQLSMNLSPNKYQIRIELEGYRTMRAKVIVDQEASTTQLFQLNPVLPDHRLSYSYIMERHKDGFMFINGFVVNPEGRPLEKAQVRCGEITTHAKEDGYFEMWVPSQDDSGMESDLVTTRSQYCSSIQKGMLLWSGGDWQTVVRLKKKDGALDADQIQMLSNPIMNDLERPASVQEIENEGSSRGFGTECLPETVNVGFSSTGENCCPGGGGGFPPCTTVQTFMLDEYVKRVLPNEWIASWNTTEAFRAAAVAIRCYTINRINFPVYGNYDICSTPCCQNFGNKNSTTSAAVDATVGFVLKKSNDDVALTEYSAENNFLFPVCSGSSPNPICSDGQFSWQGSCYSDIVSKGKHLAGHGRGMSQRGSARWSSGKVMNSCSNTLQSTNHGYGTKTWQQILGLYYPNLNLVNCNQIPGPDLTRLSESMQINGNQVTFTVSVVNIGNLTAGATSLGFLASSFDNFSFPSTLGASLIPILAPGASYTVTRTINLCDAAMPLNSGVYYVGYKIDRLEELAETDETNNLYYWPSPSVTIDCSLDPGAGTGAVQAYLFPNSAVAQGAMWRIDGGPWLPTNQYVSGVPTGNHLMTFKSVAGWNTPPAYSFNLTKDQYKIVSSPNTEYTKDYYLTLSASPVNGGSTQGAGTFQVGSSSVNTTIKAIENPGWEFDHWSENGVLFAYPKEVMISISEDRHLVAHFNQLVFYNITTLPDPVEGGFAFGTGSLPGGSSLVIEAFAKAGWMFDHWTENGNFFSSNSQVVISVNGNRTFIAHFVPVTAIQGQDQTELFQLFPNPTSSDIQIEIDPSISLVEAEVWNMTGQFLIGVTFWNGEYLVPCHSLAPGCYVLRVRSNNGQMFSKRFIVVK